MEIRLRKYFIIFILNFSIYFNYSIAQQGWYNLNVSNVGGGIYFKDANNGIVGAYKTSNGGLSWNLMGGGGEYLSFPNQNTGYGVSANFIFKTTNFGDNWVQQVNPLPYRFFYSVFFPNVNTGFACGDNASLIKTTNGGNNWFVLNLFPEDYFLSGVFFTDSATGYLIGYKVVVDSSIFSKTTNAGNNWVTQFFPIGWGRFTSIFFIDSNTGFIGAASNSHILKTTNGGVGWYLIMIPTLNRINSLYFPSSSTGYGACYGGQIIKTTSGGNNWFIQNTGTGSILYSIFFVNNLTGYASGDNNTVLKTTDGGGPPIGIKPISNNVPQEYQLFQNYPNPFNPVTRIKFSLPHPSEGGEQIVRLFIYDILGREVATLVNEKLAPGTYEVQWDGSNSSNGVYFYRIEAGTFIDTKKMILVK